MFKDHAVKAWVFTVLALSLQGIVAFQLMEDLMNGPRARLDRRLQALSEGETSALVAIAGLEKVDHYDVGDGKLLKRKGYREFSGSATGSPLIKNIPLSKTALLLVNPEYVAIRESSSNDEANNLLGTSLYEPCASFRSGGALSWYGGRINDYRLFRRRGTGAVDIAGVRGEMDSMSLEEQLLLLRECAFAALARAAENGDSKRIIERQCDVVAPLLKPFHPIDEDAYFIKPGTIALAGYFYAAAERNDDAAVAFAEVIRDGRGGVYEKWALDFFMRHSRYLKKHGLEIKPRLRHFKRHQRDSDERE